MEAHKETAVLWSTRPSYLSDKEVSVLLLGNQGLFWFNVLRRRVHEVPLRDHLLEESHEVFYHFRILCGNMYDPTLPFIVDARLSMAANNAGLGRVMILRD
mgnify:CR=1 FL=1